MKTFDDSYIIQKRLGRGGFGVVHQVQEKKTHDLYAMKEVPYSPEMTERESETRYRIEDSYKSQP